MVAVVSHLLTGAAWVIAAFTPMGALAFGILCTAQIIYGLGIGLSGPLTMSYRNAVTPTHLRGRMNTTIRSFNWGLIAIGAPLGGWLAFTFGDRVALTVAGLIMAVTGLALFLSPFRAASMSDGVSRQAGDGCAAASLAIPRL
jgi:MFS family permease